MDGNEIKLLKDDNDRILSIMKAKIDTVDTKLDGTNDLMKVQFGHVSKELKENKETTEKISVTLNEYITNHYAYHVRWTKKNMKCIIGATAITIILILSGAAAAIVSFCGGLLFKLL